MSKKILLAGNSRIALLMQCRAISERTIHEIVMATDGQDAVEKASLEQPELIIMEVTMARKSGIEACAEIRSDSRTASTPIILFSTDGERHSIDAGYLSGCSDYFVKPINDQELIGMVEAYLGV